MMPHIGLFVQYQIRSDTSLCLDETMPRIHEKASQLTQVFDKIDQLEVSDVSLSIISWQFQNTTTLGLFMQF